MQVSVNGLQGYRQLLASPLSLAANLLLVDPSGLGGMHCKARVSAWRSSFITKIRTLALALGPVIDLPVQAEERSLMGGLDWATSLHDGRLRFDAGLLERAHGGLLQIAMAERLSPQVAGLIAQSLDRRGFDQGYGLSMSFKDLNLGIMLLDEAMEDESAAPQVLCTRLAFSISEEALRSQPLSLLTASQIAKARIKLGKLQADRLRLEAGRHAKAEALLQPMLQPMWQPSMMMPEITEAAMRFGIDDLRLPLFALRGYRALEAIKDVLVSDRRRTGFDKAQSDEALGAIFGLIYVPRATRLPPLMAEQSPQNTEQSPENTEQHSHSHESSADDLNDQQVNRGAEDRSPGHAQQDRRLQADLDQHAQTAETRLEPLLAIAVESAQALLPPGLLASHALADTARSRSREGASGRSSSWAQAGLRGHSLGSRAGRPGSGARLHLMATIRAAVPWQRLRDWQLTPASESVAPLLRIEGSDLRVHRFAHREQLTSLFVVDASGSAALHRLAEVKGAVELLLADCYVRRDQVAVIAFRQEQAQLLLPPTRSLTRAKRQLRALPGGGGTPLAHALSLSARLISLWRRSGQSIQAIVLSDGKANIDLQGRPGRARAMEDALKEAGRLRQLASQGLRLTWVDTAPRPTAEARSMAQLMAARYLTLPHAHAKGLFALAS